MHAGKYQRGNRIRFLHETYRKLKSKSGTGVDSCRNEYLKVLTQDFSDDQAKRAVESHEYVAYEFVNGKLPGWYYWIAQMVNLVPLIKGPGKHRPIGMGANRRRAWSKRAIEMFRNKAASVLSPQQVAIGQKGGIAKFVKGIQLHMHGGIPITHSSYGGSRKCI